MPKYRKQGLTPTQRAFAREYLVDRNATRAAIRAGFKPGSARELGQRLLTRVAVSDAISAGEAKLAGKIEITVERVLEELGAVAFATTARLFDRETGKMIPFHQLDPRMHAAIQSFDLTTHTREDGTTEQSYRVRLAPKVQ